MTGVEEEMATHASILGLGNPMDRAWQATVPGVPRVGHDLVTKPPPPLTRRTWVIPKPQFPHR